MVKSAIRPIRIEGNIAYVPLTMGYEAIIDASDVPLIDGRSWHAVINGRSVYARHTRPRSDPPRILPMHRLILGAPIDMEVDHLDGDGLNNRRSNLRLVTKSQNMHNRRLNSNNCSGVKGVHWDRTLSRWRALIMVNGIRQNLGAFVSLEEAAQAYANASAELHGEFGRTVDLGV